MGMRRVIESKGGGWGRFFTYTGEALGWVGYLPWGSGSCMEGGLLVGHTPIQTLHSHVASPPRLPSTHPHHHPPILRPRLRRRTPRFWRCRRWQHLVFKLSGTVYPPHAATGSLIGRAPLLALCWAVGLMVGKHVVRARVFASAGDSARHNVPGRGGADAAFSAARRWRSRVVGGDAWSRVPYCPYYTNCATGRAVRTR